MNILILYYSAQRNERKTIDDHLYSFRRYDRKNKYTYFNVIWGVPRYLRAVPFDLVFFHYTFLALRWARPLWKSLYRKLVRELSCLKALKVAFPQDEYAYANDLCRFFRDVGVEVIFTCAFPEDYRKFYPERLSGVRYLFTTYTGFIDEKTLHIIGSSDFCLTPNSEREVDIGYRARSLPFWLGRHGQLKTLLAKAFLKKRSLYPDLQIDISTDERDVFTGDEWIRFLCSCRVVLGCLGGASLLDFTGKIKKKVDDYRLRCPDASFKEVEESCFPRMDGNISLFALSPRHFECSMTKTCQVLVEGDYKGLLRPNVDFIELKRDFSNLDEVMLLIKDKEYCSNIAENCYNNLVLSGKYTYAHFVSEVLSKVQIKTKKRQRKPCCSLTSYLALFCLNLSERLSFLKKILFRLALKIRRIYIGLKAHCVECFDRV